MTYADFRNTITTLQQGYDDAQAHGNEVLADIFQRTVADLLAAEPDHADTYRAEEEEGGDTN